MGKNQPFLCKVGTTTQGTKARGEKKKKNHDILKAGEEVGGVPKMRKTAAARQTYQQGGGFKSFNWDQWGAVALVLPWEKVSLEKRGPPC